MASVPATKILLLLGHGGTFCLTRRWQRRHDHPSTRHQAAEILERQRLPGIFNDRPAMFAMFVRQAHHWCLDASEEIGDGLLAKSPAAIDTIGDMFGESGQETELANAGLLPQLPHGTTQ